ncbi:MAG: hypothetical protein ABIR15_15115 [Chitinophagaceae bacterium]
MAKAVKKAAVNKRAVTEKKKTKKPATRKNKLGVKNALVNNINKRKEKGVSRSKKKSTVSKKSYKKMENNWGK